MTTTAPFDLTGALPEHLTLIEASAGTGKTYALAALATRYVAEHGVRASELCIVSFTEAATSELRGRVRARLAEAAAHLADDAPESSTARRFTSMLALSTRLAPDASISRSARAPIR